MTVEKLYDYVRYWSCLNKSLITFGQEKSYSKLTFVQIGQFPVL